MCDVRVCQPHTTIAATSSHSFPSFTSSSTFNATAIFSSYKVEAIVEIVTFTGALSSFIFHSVSLLYTGLPSSYRLFYLFLSFPHALFRSQLPFFPISQFRHFPRLVCFPYTLRYIYIYTCSVLQYRDVVRLLTSSVSQTTAAAISYRPLYKAAVSLPPLCARCALRQQSFSYCIQCDAQRISGVGVQAATLNTPPLINCHLSHQLPLFSPSPSH